MRVPVTPYARCEYCGKVVKTNKPLLGSLHLCLSPEEIERFEARRQRVDPDRQRRKGRR